ncbi:helix-turn-helix transcriptional regulator [Pseudoflavonifractor capillosus]|uniref:helix-turn-helix domain-containing protein n=1 Tax=Pseudoflavonifractor capillosus TaxID=106588 RepID=UPI00195AF995|nr:helix-turn-helix transcriptional regulator [Pseudoflavonifractor capillosus]MBM6897299.1 helix-turn-helix transcriptional regulator [Pseudoflavonifractor capillosus]
MFSENLKTLRKQKGLTQETLAIKLHITRQTISKWEKGLSVPDTEQLVRLAEVLEVPITQLLGQKVADTTNENEVAEYLAQIAEQLAIKNRRTKLIVKIVVGILVAFVIVNLLMVLMSFSSFYEITDSSEESIIVNEAERAF